MVYRLCYTVLRNWPPYSLDLNPIEHVWARLRDMLEEVDPLLHEAIGNSAALLERLEVSLRRAWEAIPQSFFDDLLDTYWHRMDAVREANGWYTKY